MLTKDCPNDVCASQIAVGPGAVGPGVVAGEYKGGTGEHNNNNWV